jgi:hypothetical protein
LHTAPYDRDGHYARIDTPSGRVRIDDYSAYVLAAFDQSASHEGERRQALERGKTVINLEHTDAATGVQQAYLVVSLADLIQGGMTESMLRPSLPDGWPEEEPLVWKMRGTDSPDITTLTNPFDDQKLREVYISLGGEIPQSE